MSMTSEVSWIKAVNLRFVSANSLLYGPLWFVLFDSRGSILWEMLPKDIFTDDPGTTLGQNQLW